MTELCARPSCGRRKTKASHGFCHAHAEAYGLVNGFIPATPTRTIINHLLDNGWSRNTIAAAAGVSMATISRAASGEFDRVRVRTAKKVAALADAPAPHPHRVDAWPYQRRLQALQAAGYTQPTIARMFNIPSATVSRVTTGMVDQVSVEVAERIIEAWEHWYTLPVGKPTPMAKRCGWVTPMAWDDIDDPEEQPGHTHCLKCGDRVLARGLCKRCYEVDRYHRRKVAQSA